MEGLCLLKIKIQTDDYCINYAKKSISEITKNINIVYLRDVFFGVGGDVPVVMGRSASLKSVASISHSSLSSNITQISSLFQFASDP